MRHETSQTLAKVFELLKEDGIGKSDIARDLFVLQEDLDNLTFCLTISSVASAPRSIKITKSSVPRPSLKLVGSN